MRLLIAFVLFSGVCQAQVGTGQWRLHVPTRQCKDVAATSTAAYGAYVNGVLEYDFASKEVSMWDAVNGLSDISIACLGHSSSNDAVFIGYENGNIDKIKGSKVTNIPAIKLAEIQGAKMIHNIVEYEEYMYFATGFAIVKIDPVKNEVRDTYYATNGNAAILDLAFRNDSIFALTSTQMPR